MNNHPINSTHEVILEDSLANNWNGLFDKNAGRGEWALQATALGYRRSGEVQEHHAFLHPELQGRHYRLRRYL